MKKKLTGELFSLPPMTNSFVKKLIKSMSANKGTGVNKVLIRLLKICVNEIVESLTYIMNRVLKLVLFQTSGRLLTSEQYLNQEIN